jgi:hypothetical protein
MSHGSGAMTIDPPEYSDIEGSDLRTSRSSANSETSLTMYSGGAGVNVEVSYIERNMRKEAKYVLKRPNNSNETRCCLRKDDMDLMGNYLSHTERTF